jgi:hypothetical protein
MKTFEQYARRSLWGSIALIRRLAATAAIEGQPDGADQVAPLLGIEPATRPVESTKSQNITVTCRRSPNGLSNRRVPMCDQRRCQFYRRVQTYDCFEKALAVPQGDARLSRSRSVRSDKTSASISLSRNVASPRRQRLSGSAESPGRRPPRGVLLIGGHKCDDNRFCERMVPVADNVYDTYIEEIRKEGLIP